MLKETQKDNVIFGIDGFEIMLLSLKSNNTSSHNKW